MSPMPSPRRADAPQRGLRLRHAVLLVGFVVVGLCLLAIPFIGAPGSAQAARADLDAAQAALQEGDVAAASEHTASARSHVDEVQDAVQGVGGDVWSVVPIAGGPVRDVRRLGNALDELTAIAEIGVDAWPQLSGKSSTLFDDGNVDLPTLERLLADLDAVADRAEAAEAELADVEDERLGVGTRLADLRDQALERVTPLSDGIQSVQPMLGVLPRVLGGEGERKYLVAMLNPSEMLYSGGTPQTFTTMAFDNGRIEVGETIDLATSRGAFQRRYWKKVKGNPFHRGRLQVALSTFAPDWKVSGNELVNAWRAFRGRPMAGVIAVDVVALADLVAITGPIDLPPYGTLTADNLVENLVGSYDRHPDNAARHETNRALVPLFRERLFGEGHLAEKVQVLGDAARGRHFATYFRDPEVQAAFADAGLSGELAEADHDYLGVFTQNAVGSKSDYWQRRSVSSRVQVNRDGSARVRLQVAIHNDSPPYVQPTPDLKTGYFTRWNTLSIAPFIAPGATIRSAAVDGRDFDFNQGDFFGRPFLRRTVEFAPQARHTLTVTYDVPRAAAVHDDGSLTYVLDLDPQGMVDPQAMDVRVSWPRGFRAAPDQDGWRSGRGRASTYRTDGLTETTTLRVTASR